MSKHITHPHYRADIDGLRAIAILSVVLFHIFPSWLLGGFVGVDVFFVISGFLISTIIFDSLHRNSFSFAEFYSHRIKRIFPALLVVLCACMVFGWFVLFKDEYKQLTQYVVGGAAFISNFILWRENGYFDNAIITKPLMHLWSLGIEEQFYIVWPFLLYAAHRLKLNLLTVAFLIALVSFILNTHYVYRHPIATFYSPQTRFWELMVGSILAHLTLKPPKQSAWLKQKIDSFLGKIFFAEPPAANGQTLKNVQAILGAILIAIGIFCTYQPHFPGWWALAPTLGAAFIISAGSEAWFNRAVLSCRGLVWIGLISYPLYLWHWPLLSFAQILYGETPPIGVLIAIIVFAFVFAWLTYRIVEKPIRYRKDNRVAWILSVLMVLVALFAYQGYMPNYIAADKVEFENYIYNYNAEERASRLGGLDPNREDCNFYDSAARGDYNDKEPRERIGKDCYLRNSTQPKAVFLWGDSHAQMLYFGLKNNLPGDWQILQVTSNSCIPSLDDDTNTQRWCPRSNSFALQAIKDAKPDVVIVAQVSRHDASGSKIIADKLKELGVKKVLFTGPVPSWNSDLPRIVLRQLWATKPERTFAGINPHVMDDNARLKDEYSAKKLNYIDMLNVFCNPDGCLVRVGGDMKTGITSYDSAHLTPIASDYLAKKVLVDVVTGIK